MDDASGWNRLLPSLVDKLVTVIKQNGRWAKEGRALRSLNKHWCECINFSIIRVRPAANRMICSEDVQSLLKFPNLESVDILPFIIADHKFGYSMFFRTKWLRRLDKAETKQRLVNVLTVLAQAKNLIEMFLDEKLQVIKKCIWMDREVSDLMKKLQVKSIEHDAGRFYPKDLVDAALSSGWPLEELTKLQGSPEILNHILDSTSLRKLDISTARLTYTPQLHRQIMALGKSCSKCLWFSILPDPGLLDLISEVKNVEALSLDFSLYQNLRPLSKMKSLQHIKIRLNDDHLKHLHLRTLRSTAERWTREICFVTRQVKLLSLDLCLWARMEGLTDEKLSNGFASVKCLRLGNWFTTSFDFLKYFSNLDFLEVASTVLDDRMGFDYYVNKLKMIENKTTNSLTRLQFSGGTLFRKCFFESVKKWRNLEFLSLRQNLFRNIQCLNCLSQLTNLRHLELRFDGTPISLRSLPHLEVLKHLDTLHLCWTQQIRNFFHTIKYIEKNLPELKITTEAIRFEERYKEYS